MPNTLITSEIITREWMAILKDSLELSAVVNRSYDEKFISDQNGISMRMMREFNAESTKNVARYDVLYGVASIKPYQALIVSEIKDSNSLGEVEPPLPVLGAPRLYNCDDVASVGPLIITPRRSRRVGSWVGADVLTINLDAVSWNALKRAYDYDPATNRFFVPGMVPVAQQQVALGAPRAYFND